MNPFQLKHYQQFLLAAFGTLFLCASCQESAKICQESECSIPDIGQGFQTDSLFAPWDGLATPTRFCCHSTEERFYFNFEVEDSTLTVSEPCLTEDDILPEDRVELFFSQDSLMNQYYCAEMDAAARKLDNSGKFFRQLDFDWKFSTMELDTMWTSFGYRVGGSIALSELRELGMDLENGFWLGVFQADFRKDGTVNWYSLVKTDDEKPDFHKPNVLFKCKMTPKKEHRGVVIYPSDIISVGIEEWERRIDLSGVNVIGLHAATFHEPVDVLEEFVKSDLGKEFMAMCKKKGVDVEYEIHALSYLLPRSLYETHPEYFREKEDGKRDPEYNLCFSSEEAIEAMRPQIEKLLKWMHPTTHRYFFWPDDGRGMCFCPQCRKLSNADQCLLYENRLLSILKEYDPEATLSHLAYFQAIDAPTKIRASKDIFLEFAPISRNYEEPLPLTSERALRKNLLAFPGFSQHILEYWLDESMFSVWKKDSLVPFPNNKGAAKRDIGNYRKLGATSFTTFATWLNQDYIDKYGKTDDIFASYKAAFDLNLPSYKAASNLK